MVVYGLDGYFEGYAKGFIYVSTCYKEFLNMTALLSGNLQPFFGAFFS
jgi:hypothetical protein